MKQIIVLLLALCLSSASQGQQSIENVLNAVESNNSTLKALREQTQAKKLANRSGISLTNPEVEYGHLWGSPSAIGKRNDLSVSQKFDLGTVLGIKRRLALAQNNMQDVSLSIERTAILLRAKELCYDLIYYNAMVSESEARLVDARATAVAYDKLLKQGKTNIIDSNKAQINLTSAEALKERTSAQRDAILNYLTGLGATEAELTNLHSDIPTLPADFDSWFAEAAERSPELLYATNAVEVASRGIWAAKAGSLPTISAGYMREQVVGEGYQGIKVGVSIPLWENRNRVKQARTELRAAQATKLDREIQLRSELRSLYINCESLYSTSQRYTNSTSLETAPTILRKAFDMGQLSMLDYFTELAYFYSAREEMLSARRDYMKSLSRLNAFEL